MGGGSLPGKAAAEGANSGGGPVAGKGAAEVAQVRGGVWAGSRPLPGDVDRVLMGVAVTEVVSAGSPLKVLLAEAEAARMVVLGPVGDGEVPGVPVGSLPSRLAGYAACPVAVVRDGGDGPVVVGIDGGPASEAVLDAAFDEAASRRVPLVAVHAWSDAEFEDGPRYVGWEPVAEAENRVLGENLTAWQEKYPDVTLRRIAVRARPRHLLLEWSRRAQLVVIGARGRGGFDGLPLGSAAQALVQYGHGAVLVVPSAG
ncbi:nucleotide-binding universal stress UspA family protein [Amycolatopsis bartoniae]|nr:universal stress protein [Amycolatopsis bartoniae]MBB2935632.1 nucleotide-binding universal stress UspA family protein [Amycolatopsis bartoniae]